MSIRAEKGIECLNEEATGPGQHALGVPRRYPEQSITYFGQTYNLSGLDAEEVQNFDDQLKILIGDPDSEEQRLFMHRWESILLGIRAIKFKLKGPAFRGMFALDNELGWRLIRPRDTASGGTYAAPTRNTVWAFALTTSWADWLFSAAATAYNLGNIDHNYGLIWFYLKSPLTAAVIPQVGETNFKLDRTQSIIIDVRGLRLTDNKNQVPIFPVPTMVALPDTDVYARIIGDTAQTEEVALGGVCVGLGRFIKSET